MDAIGRLRQHAQSFSQKTVMARLLQLLVGITLFLLVATGSQAQALGPYEGEVEVASQSEVDRLAALPRALEQVLHKQGSPHAQTAAAEADAARLLQQYRYRQGWAGQTGSGERQLFLIARFDQDGVRNLLGAQADATWAKEQPQPILWLAIDDGSGARIVSADAAAAITALTTRAAQRGINLRLPRYDATDQATVIARDLASEETWAVDTATARYGGPALIGWMRRDDDGWLADWRVRDGSGELGRWRNREVQALDVLTAAADGAAEVLLRRSAQASFSGQPGRYPVVIEGVSNAAAYADLMALLRRQPIVIEVHPVRVDQSRLEAELELSAGIENLAQLLRGSVLEPVFVGGLESPSEFALQAH